jgi:O-antigen ligase
MRSPSIPWSEPKNPRRALRGAGVGLLALVIGAATVFHPALATLGVIGLGVIALALRDPAILVVAHLLFCTLGEPWGLANLSFSFAGLNVFPTDILVIVLAGAWLLGALQRGRLPSRPRDPILVVMALYLTYGCLSLVRSLPLHGRDALPDFRLQFVYALLFFLSLWAFERPDARRRFLGAIFAAAATISLLGFWNAATGHNTGGTTSSFTLRFLSGLQALAIFFGLALLAGYVWSVRRPLWSLALGALFLGGVLLSQARSVWLGGALGVLVAIVGASRVTRRRLLRQIPLVAFVTLAALAAVIAINLGLSQDLATRAASLAGVSDDLTTVWRLYVWNEAAKELSASPLLGLGLGQPFVYYDIVKGDWQSDRQLHNSHLELAYYTGILGAFILVAFQVLVLLRTIASARRYPGTPKEAQLLALVVCQVSLAGVAFTNVISASMVATHYVWILSAVSVLEARTDARGITS